MTPTGEAQTGPRIASVAAFALMVAGIAWLMQARELFARSAVGIAVQVAAAALMIAARVTFGRRSFHAAANPTAGGVVSTGPYRYLRHPIYAAIIYFAWATAIDHWSPRGYGAAALITVGAIIRMLLEERLLVLRYPEYRDYMKRTRRVVPFVL